MAAQGESKPRGDALERLAKVGTYRTLGEQVLSPQEERFEKACARIVERGADVIIPADGVLNEFLVRRGRLTAQGGIPHPRALNDYLFNDCGITGPPSEDYYNPLNSDLVHALETRRGIPETDGGEARRVPPDHGLPAL